MAVEFRLTLAGDLPLEHVVDLVATDTAESRGRSTPIRGCSVFGSTRRTGTR